VARERGWEIRDFRTVRKADDALPSLRPMAVTSASQSVQTALGT
jgi:hypothetical protein